MRVSVQLIDHGVTRWGSRYDLQGHDLLRFEDDVAQKVVDGLRVQLSGGTVDIPWRESRQARRGLIKQAERSSANNSVVCELARL